VQLIRRHPRAAALAGAALLVALAALLIVLRYAPLAHDARELRSTVASVAAQVRTAGPDLDTTDVARLRQEAVDARARHGRLADALGDPLFAVARVVPVVGDQVRGADRLLAASDLLLGVLDDGLSLADRYASMRARVSSGGDRLAALVALAAEAHPLLVAARERVDAALANLDAIPDAVIGPIRAARDEAVEQLREYRPLLETAVDASAIGPTLLGSDGPRRYLLLLQDPAELRPMGGYIGSYGLVTFDGGRIADKIFRDILTLDSRPGLPFVEPPRPLRDHLLGSQSWRLADSAWSPDGPTAAREAMRLFDLESGGERIAGVIYLTTYAVDELLAVTGPITVPAYDVTIQPGDATFGILAATRSPLAPLGDRKAFLGAFADVFLERLLDLPPRQWLELPDRLERIRAERHASLVLSDGAEQAAIAAAGWDGAIPDPTGDEVLLVEANVGPVSKLHLVTDRTVSVDIELDRDGRAFGAVEITWNNRIRDETADAWTRNASSVLLNSQLRDVMGAYVRLLVPAGSVVQEVIVDGDGVRRGGLELVDEELGRASFGAYVMVPPGRTTLRYAWVTPPVTTYTGGNIRYALSLPKPAGRLADPLAVSVRLPEGARLVEMSGIGLATVLLRDESAVRLEQPWRADVELRLTYTLEPPGAP